MPKSIWIKAWENNNNKTAKMDQLRREYTKAVLHETDLIEDPMSQFKIWFDEVIPSGIQDPNAMVLSTVGPDLKPSSRVVLLKSIEKDGFVFFTNYLSRKGHELQLNTNACLLFFWDKLERQIRIEGHVKMIDPKLSDEYFYSRPVQSQIGAIISPQSQEIKSRKELEEKFKSLESQRDQIKRPEHWGGYLLKPEYFEFWQGRESRLHDRIIYEWQDDTWNIARLAP